MSGLKPVIREVREAVLTGAARAKDRLHQVAHNLDGHFDDVTRQVRHRDHFDDAPATPRTPNRDAQGRFAADPNRSSDSMYDRPSGYRAGTRDRVWDDAIGPDGRVRDPETNDVLDPDQPWVMGHRPGQEFRHHQRSAQERGIPRDQFLDEHNDPSRYRPESPSTSSGHRHELDWDDYVGP